GDTAVVLYIRGGAFVTPLGAPLRMVAAELALAAGLRVFAIDYRLLPEHVYPAAHDDVFNAYRELSRRELIVVGDSTGGVLALAALLRARTAGLPQPRLCVLLSPVVDYGVRARAGCDDRRADLAGDVARLVRHGRPPARGPPGAAGDGSAHPRDRRRLTRERAVGEPEEREEHRAGRDPAERRERRADRLPAH